MLVITDGYNYVNINDGNVVLHPHKGELVPDVALVTDLMRVAYQ